MCSADTYTATWTPLKNCVPEPQSRDGDSFDRPRRLFGLPRPVWRIIKRDERGLHAPAELHICV